MQFSAPFSSVYTVVIMIINLGMVALVAITLIELIKFLKLKNAALRKNETNAPQVSPSETGISVSSTPEDAASEQDDAKDKSSAEEPPQ